MKSTREVVEESENLQFKCNHCYIYQFTANYACFMHRVRTNDADN